MKFKNFLCGLAVAVVLQLGMLAGSAQTNIYLFSGSETNITLNPGTYIITAYGAPGGLYENGGGGLGAEMSAEFNFSTPTNLTLLVGGGGSYTFLPTSGGGGGGSFVVEGSTPLVIAGGGGGNGAGRSGGRATFGGYGNISTNGGEGVLYRLLAGGAGGTNGGGGAGGLSDFNDIGYEGTPDGGGGGGGGGGGSIIDSSALAILAKVSGIASPDDPPNVDQGYSGNGEIIITAVPTPIVITTSAAFGFTNGVFGFNLIGPSGSNVVIQASTDLQTWIPLQTNLLGTVPLYFSDPQSTTNSQRFYRAQLAASAYTVGGTLTGLPAGDTVTLQDNGSDNLTLSTNGTFTFPTPLPNGHAYSVTGSGTSGGTLAITIIANGSGTISGANVTNVAVRWAGPALTGNMDLDMYNAAVADGAANGGVPGVMLTDNGGPFRVTAAGTYSVDVAYHYSSSCQFVLTLGSNSCSSTTFPSGTPVIQFGGAVVCGAGNFNYGY